MRIICAAAVAILKASQAVGEEYEPFTFGWVVELEAASVNDGTQVWAATAEASLAVSLSNRLTLNSEVVFEPVVEGNGSSFSQEGAYIGVLELTYKEQDWSISVGKIGPHFSTAYEFGLGVGAVEAGELYELAEQLGVRGEFSFDSAAEAIGASAASISGSVFTSDRTVLSNSFLRERGRLRWQDGGAGNTGRLDSFAIALDLDDVGAEGLSTHASVRRLAGRGSAIPDDEALAVAVVYAPPAQGIVTPYLNVEYIRLRSGEDAGESFIAGVGVQYGRLSAAASRIRNWSNTGGAKSVGTLSEIWLAYEFLDNLSAGIALQEQSGFGSTDTAVVLRLSASAF